MSVDGATEEHAKVEGAIDIPNTAVATGPLRTGKARRGCCERGKSD